VVNRSFYWFAGRFKRLTSSICSRRVHVEARRRRFVFFPKQGLLLRQGFSQFRLEPLATEIPIRLR